MSDTLLKSFACGMALAFVMPAVPPAFAQQNDIEALSEIVVTARKREESILEAPVAITAFGAQEIRSLGLENIEDVQLFTPGFVFEAFATTPGRFDQSPRFRGIDIDTGSPLRQTSSVFVDGLFVVNGASGISLDDVERVEVIKGPQSATFGRNTFGGAVNYISKIPGNEFGGNVSVMAATRDEYKITGAVEGAISDSVSARLSGSFHNRDGHYDNPDVSGGTLGDEETWSVTGSIFFAPNDRFSGKLRVNYFENDDGAPAVARTGQAEFNCGPFGGPADDLLICGDLPAGSVGMNADVQLFGDPDAFLTTARLTNSVGSARSQVGFDRSSLSISANLSFDITDNIELSSLTGFGDDETNLLNDGDETAELAFVAANAREFRMFSQEFRLAGTAVNDRLDWSVGVNYFDQRFRNTGGFIRPTNGVPFSDNFGNPDEESIETLGIFGGVTYAVSDRVALTFEARYQIDDVTEDDDTLNSAGGSAPQNGEFKEFLPRAIVEFQATLDTLIYGSVSQGNLPGGFNGAVATLIEDNPAAFAELQDFEPSVGDEFSEENLTSFEVGLKHGFADGKGSIAAAAYFMERDDQVFRRSQVLANDDGETTSYFINAGGSDIKGLELEGNYLIASSLRVQGNVGYVDAEYTSFESGIYNEIFGVLDAAGSTAPRFPEWSGALSLITDWDISSEMSWFGRADWAYVGERFTDEGNLTTTRGGSILNLRTGIETEAYRLELFAKNLTDSDLATGAGRSRDLALGFAGFSIFGYREGLRDRVQFGLRLDVDF